MARAIASRVYVPLEAAPKLVLEMAQGLQLRLKRGPLPMDDAPFAGRHTHQLGESSRKLRNICKAGLDCDLLEWHPLNNQCPGAVDAVAGDDWAGVLPVAAVKFRWKLRSDSPERSAKLSTGIGFAMLVLTQLISSA